MNETPFGFGKPDDPDEPGKSGGGPGDPFGFSSLFGGTGGPGMPGGMSGADFGAALHRFADLMSWQGGPVNWDLAIDVARQVAANPELPGGGDRSPDSNDARLVAEAIRLADLWLDEATDIGGGTVGAQAWSRAEWIEGTRATWATLVEPVAARVADAFEHNLGGLTGRLGLGAPGEPGVDPARVEGLPEEMRQFAGPMLGMMRQLSGVMFGSQVGQALGTLAREVVGSTDIGLPLGQSGRAALLPAGVAAFGEGLGVPADDVRLFLALREAAHHRLYGHVHWLRARVIAAVEDYARGITVDTAHLEETLGRIDPSNPEAMQEAFTEGLFEPQNTPAQEAALRRLETLLALVEGWVDDVVATAAGGRLTSTGALAETVRRRRASGGAAEQAFAALVGLELRPRRLRDASALWRALRETGGAAARDALWAHPDLLPSADDLDDPAGFATRGGAGAIPDDLSGLDDQPPADAS